MDVILIVNKKENLCEKFNSVEPYGMNNSNIKVGEMNKTEAVIKK